jgi:hypothetical protein
MLRGAPPAAGPATGPVGPWAARGPRRSCTALILSQGLRLIHVVTVTPLPCRSSCLGSHVPYPWPSPRRRMSFRCSLVQRPPAGAHRLAYLYLNLRVEHSGSESAGAAHTTRLDDVASDHQVQTSSFGDLPTVTRPPALRTPPWHKTSIRPVRSDGVVRSLTQHFR